MNLQNQAILIPLPDETPPKKERRCRACHVKISEHKPLDPFGLYRCKNNKKIAEERDLSNLEYKKKLRPRS